jgi:hypothetical protein
MNLSASLDFFVSFLGQAKNEKPSGLSATQMKLQESPKLTKSYTIYYGFELCLILYLSFRMLLMRNVLF